MALGWGTMASAEPLALFRARLGAALLGPLPPPPRCVDVISEAVAVAPTVTPTTSGLEYVRKTHTHPGELPQEDLARKQPSFAIHVQKGSSLGSPYTAVMSLLCSLQASLLRLTSLPSLLCASMGHKGERD